MTFEVTTLVFISIILSCNCQNFNRDYVGVAFSPYTKQRVNGQIPWFNSYDINDVKKQLLTINSKFNRISTYGMGTAGYNRQNDWDKADSNCLIAKAAAELNADRNQKLFTVSQGVFQQSDADLQRIEIDRAFKAAEYSNNKYRGTVESIVFTNEYFTDDSKGWQVLNMIQSNKDRARRLGLAVGTRTHVCGHILDPKSASYASLEAIVKNSDIIMCNIYPASDVVHSGIDRAISAVTNFYWALRDRFTKINPQIKVAIGESGWASQGNMFNGAPTSVANLVNYWNQLGDWASRNNILLYLFEAIDEPWKGDSNSAESHFGWWYREGDNFKAKS